VTGFVLFGGILVILLTTMVWAALRAGEDTGAVLDPAERRDAAIEALRDLELDYQTRKINPEEYQLILSRLEREALRARDEEGMMRMGPGSFINCGQCGVTLEEGSLFCHLCGVARDVGMSRVP
jgi:hypothetical protein